MDKQKKIERAEALASLEGNPGWEIVKGHLEQAIVACQRHVFDTKKVKSWNEYLFYRAKYDAFTKLLFLIERWKDEGLKAKAEKEDADAQN